MPAPTMFKGLFPLVKQTSHPGCRARQGPGSTHTIQGLLAVRLQECSGTDRYTDQEGKRKDAIWRESEPLGIFRGTSVLKAQIMELAITKGRESALTEHLWCTRNCSRVSALMWMRLFLPAILGSWHYQPRALNEDTEMQRGEVNCRHHVVNRKGR